MRSLARWTVMLLGLPVAAAQQTSRTVPSGSPALAAAYATYQAGNFASAVTELQAVVTRTPNDFAARELLGLSYAALGNTAKAEAELHAAVSLDPGSAAAHSNLATSLIHLGRASEAEAEWKKALQLQPDDFSSARSLAKFYLQQGQTAMALPLLQTAHTLQPTATDVTYDLALALLVSGKLPEARAEAQKLANAQDNDEVHNLLGQVDEKQGRYLEAEEEFSAAAHRNPSDDNFFAWGAELLSHRAYVGAITVFRSGTEHFPSSPRLWVGLGMSLYSRGEYKESVHALLAAADLSAADPRCYLFLSKAYLSSPDQVEDVIGRFKKYAEANPTNAAAQFYYGMSLWKGRRMDAAAADTTAAEKLLRRSLTLNNANAEAHLQLGVLLSDERRNEEALTEFQTAESLDPHLPDAHFRLGRIYLRAGDKGRGDHEIAEFQRLQATHQAEVDKERAAVQQFVLTTDEAPAAQP